MKMQTMNPEIGPADPTSKRVFLSRISDWIRITAPRVPNGMNPKKGGKGMK
jgi:hypothetical protein